MRPFTEKCVTVIKYTPEVELPEFLEGRVFASLAPRILVNSRLTSRSVWEAALYQDPALVVLRRVQGESKMKSLFVGNMSFQTSESELRELFAPFGQVTRVHMAMDRETGRARGFAFVEMPNDAEAAQAMTALDGKEVGGRNLKVNEARPKGEGGPPRGPRNFGGPGGGGGRGKGGGRDRFSNEDYRESARQPREPRW
jgi:cold-inducible RNA-binding protein